MTGKEAQDILSKILRFKHLLISGDERVAFFEMGWLANHLSNIVEIDRVSFNPTVPRKNEETAEEG